MSYVNKSCVFVVVLLKNVTMCCKSTKKVTKIKIMFKNKKLIFVMRACCVFSRIQKNTTPNKKYQNPTKYKNPTKNVQKN